MKRLKDLRAQRGMKQADLANLLRVRQTTISNWENEVTEIDKQSLFKLAEYFGVTTDYLLGKSDTPNPDYQPLVIPAGLENAMVAFARGEFEDLLQDEVDALARIATTFKQEREGLKKQA